MFMNLAGLKLVMPSTPYDAKGLMKSAIRDNNPVVFFEDQILAASASRGPSPANKFRKFDRVIVSVPPANNVVSNAPHNRY